MARGLGRALSWLVIVAALSCGPRDASDDAGPLDDTALPSDLDGDGIPDHLDSDIDGDGLENVDEQGADGSSIDTDGDGAPDTHDLDSDGDTILDSVERDGDRDGDGTPSFRDLDSDGDDVGDAIEAGDADLQSPPRVCRDESDADEHPDYLDVDSDGDGLADGEEAALRTDPCDADSDDDGFADLDEGAYERVRCVAGASECGCATRADCTIPAAHVYAVLPLGSTSTRDVELDTTVRSADVFFLLDTTTSMGGTLENVKRTIAAPGTGLVARIGATIPDARIGGAQHDDFAFGSYGGSSDEPLIVALRMTPLDRAAQIAAAFATITLHGGGDRPESQTEALHQTITGEGGSWTSSVGGGSYSMRRYQDDCLDGTWGAPCFRSTALPVIVLFTDICSHNGPPDDDRAACDDYAGITPVPALWADTMSAMNARGAKLVGVNASGVACGEDGVAGGDSPCWFLRRSAAATGSVDLEGRPLVFDLPNASSASTFGDTVARAIDTLATEVRTDVHTELRDDPTDPAAIDATRFVTRRRPACERGPTETCWEAPSGTAHEDAVQAHDASGLTGVVPGTRVLYELSFRNDFQGGGLISQVHASTIELRGGGGSVLDARAVYVIIPADDDAVASGWRNGTE